VSADLAEPAVQRLAFKARRAIGTCSQPDWGLDPILKASRQAWITTDREWRYDAGDVVEPPANFHALGALLLHNVWHLRCVRLKARITAGSHPLVRPRDAGRAAPELANGEADALGALVRKANPDQSLTDVLYRVQFDIEALGNGYLEVIRDRLGRPVELYHVPAINVRIARGKDGKPRGFWQMDRASRRRVFFKTLGDFEPLTTRGDVASSSDADLATELIHLADYHPSSSYYGLPSIVTALVPIEGSRAAESWNADFFRHNTIPRKIITFLGGEPSDELLEEIEDYFSSVAQGRNHRPLILYAQPTSGDPDLDNTRIDVKDLETTDQDAGFLKYLENNRDLVIAAHGVPPSLVGVQSAGRLGGKSSDELARKDFKVLVIEPRQDVLEQAINECLVADGWKIRDWVIQLQDFDLSDTGQALAKAEQLRKLVAAGLLTVNEARVEMGRHPYLDGDAPLANKPSVQTSGGLVFLEGDGRPEGEATGGHADPTESAPPTGDRA